MILIDYSAISLAAIVANLSRENAKTIDLHYGQHMVLNSLKHFVKLFQGKFGYPVVCCDSRKSWRKEYFYQYKAGRAAGRASSPLDWEAIFAVVDSVKDGLKSAFPVYVVEEDGYEADDLIAAFALGTNAPTIICSEDKDFYQLLCKPNLWIYHNRRKEFFETGQNSKQIQDWMDAKFRKSKFYSYNVVGKCFAEDYLTEQIIRGDGIDGVPNMLSADDTFTSNKRQTPLTKKQMIRLTELIKNGNLNELSTEERANYDRNKKLISLEPMRDELREIVKTVLNQGKPKSNLLQTQKWLMDNTLVKLANAAQDFYQKVDQT